MYHLVVALQFEGEGIVKGYKVENGGIQVLFQNSAGVNPASHSVGTVDSFLEFKGAEERDQNKTHIAEV
jgi:hypothetical protein